MLLYYIMVSIKLYTRVGNYDCIIMCNIGGLYLDRSLRERGGLRSPSPNHASSHEAKKKKGPVWAQVAQARPIVSVTYENERLQQKIANLT